MGENFLKNKMQKNVRNITLTIHVVAKHLGHQKKKSKNDWRLKK